MKRRHFLKQAAAASALALGAPSFARAENPGYKRIYVVFKTHLDIGFTTFSPLVIDRYIEHFIPRAMNLAREMRDAKGASGMIWTTGSWLIWEFLERAAPGQRKQMEEAIAAGDIAWHALPMTFHSELVERDHFRYGLTLSSRLDARFGKRTLAAKMTDVPGHTRTIVPLLAEAGVRFLHVGVNPASAAPETPALFEWRDPASDTSVLTAYSKGDYGGLIAGDGLDSGLFIAMTGDNQGPQTAKDIANLYAGLGRRFPGAELVPGRIDDFAADALKKPWPRIEQELGDTWIHGAGSAPSMVSAYRRLNRWIRQQKPKTDKSQAALDACQRRLLLVPEHTWGLDEKTFLNDFTHWDKATFQARRKEAAYQKMEQSWADKRNVVTQALGELKGTPLYRGATASVRMRIPKAARGQRVERLNQTCEQGRFTARVGTTGALEHLEDRSTGVVWATPDHPLALFRYEVYPLDAFKRFYAAYVIQDAQWARCDLGKVWPGNAEAEAAYAQTVPQTQSWHPSLTALYTRQRGGALQVCAEMQGPSEACEKCGCPRVFEVHYTLGAPDPGKVHIEFVFRQKDAVRLGEALWLSFVPPVLPGGQWTFFKMGRSVDPLGVVAGGNQHLHAVQPGVCYHGGGKSLHLDSIDAAVCAPGAPELLRFDNEKPDLRGGVHFNLYNNVWGTNFHSWYDADTRYEFVLDFQRDMDTGKSV